jgi:hypothetical protein
VEGHGCALGFLAGSILRLQRVDDEEAHRKLRYMHRNPVKRELVSSPEQWRWSGYRFYSLDEAGPVLVNQGWGEICFRASAA